MDFKEAINKVNEILVTSPNALTVVLDKDGYHYAENNVNAKKVRKQVREVLSALWQSGAYNYETIATYLRVQPLDIQAVLDDEWREKHIK